MRSCECACLPNAWAHGCDLARCECAFCQTHGRLGVISPSGLFGSKDQKPRLLRLFACCCKESGIETFLIVSSVVPLERQKILIDVLHRQKIIMASLQRAFANTLSKSLASRSLIIKFHDVRFFHFFHRFPSFSTCFTSFTSSPAPIVFIFMHIVSSLFHSCFDRPD